MYSRMQDQLEEDRRKREAAEQKVLQIQEMWVEQPREMHARFAAYDAQIHLLASANGTAPPVLSTLPSMNFQFGMSSAGSNNKPTPPEDESPVTPATTSVPMPNLDNPNIRRQLCEFPYSLSISCLYTSCLKLYQVLTI